MKLSETEVANALSQIVNWKLDGKMIVRRYSFSSFPTAISFVNRVADIAEERNHHPFIQIDFKHVTLKLTSWHAAGLTMQDFEEARAFDIVFDDI